MSDDDASELNSSESEQLDDGELQVEPLPGPAADTDPSESSESGSDSESKPESDHGISFYKTVLF